MRQLTHTGLLAEAPGEKPRKLNFGAGLFCLVTPAGGKLWNFRYKIDGKEKKLSLGTFPDVKITDAKAAADRARVMLADGIDPGAAKRQAKEEKSEARRNTFAYFAQPILDRALATYDPATCRKWKLHMGYALAKFGDRPIAEITKVEVVEFLRSWERLGKVSTMQSIKRKMSLAFVEAVDLDACTKNPCDIAKTVLAPVNHKARAAILEPVRFGQLLRAIDEYVGQPATVALLKLSALCFQRPGEMRKMRWSEIDWENALWEIPAERMKKVKGERRPHLVPLSRQALAVLRDLQLVTGSGQLAFPALGKPSRPVSDATVLVALRRMDFAKDEMSGHGFRASANTLLKERVRFPDWIIDRNDVIQRQLAHTEKDEVAAAYDRSVLLRERTWMMQAWADYCDVMRKGGKVVPIGGGASVAESASAA